MSLQYTNDVEEGCRQLKRLKEKTPVDFFRIGLLLQSVAQHYASFVDEVYKDTVDLVKTVNWNYKTVTKVRKRTKKIIDISNFERVELKLEAKKKISLGTNEKVMAKSTLFKQMWLEKRHDDEYEHHVVRLWDTQKEFCGHKHYFRLNHFQGFGDNLAQIDACEQIVLLSNCEDNTVVQKDTTSNNIDVLPPVLQEEDSDIVDDNNNNFLEEQMLPLGNSSSVQIEEENNDDDNSLVVQEESTSNSDIEVQKDHNNSDINSEKEEAPLVPLLAKNTTLPISTRPGKRNHCVKKKKKIFKEKKSKRLFYNLWNLQEEPEPNHYFISSEDKSTKKQHKKRKTLYDVNKYSKFVMEWFEKDDHVEFSSKVQQESREEIARLFLTTLHLANNNKVVLSQTPEMGMDQLFISLKT